MTALQAGYIPKTFFFRICHGRIIPGLFGSYMLFVFTG
jgi:hypothetical protein